MPTMPVAPVIGWEISGMVFRSLLPSRLNTRKWFGVSRAGRIRVLRLSQWIVIERLEGLDLSLIKGAYCLEGLRCRDVLFHVVGGGNIPAVLTNAQLDMLGQAARIKIRGADPGDQPGDSWTREENTESWGLTLPEDEGRQEVEPPLDEEWAALQRAFQRRG